MTFGIALLRLAGSGFEYMFAGGDVKKLQAIKDRYPKIIFGFVISMSAYILATFLINIIQVKDPNECFATDKPLVRLGDVKIAFQFVFAKVCRGTTP